MTTNAPAYEKTAPRLSISVLGNSLGLFFAITFALCVLFDLIFPGYAMNQVWSPLLPGFVWLTWSGFIIGLVESFAYGWYAAIVLVPLYNFFVARSLRTVVM